MTDERDAHARVTDTVIEEEELNAGGPGRESPTPKRQKEETKHDRKKNRKREFDPSNEESG